MAIHSIPKSRYLASCSLGALGRIGMGDTMTRLSCCAVRLDEASDSVQTIFVYQAGGQREQAPKKGCLHDAQ